MQSMGAVEELEIEGIIPPQENAIYWVDEFDELLDLDRNKILRKNRGNWQGRMEVGKWLP
ncbi:MAG: hypothetical protein R2825_06090 [Saprospiraceae bacterium]